MHVGNMSHIVGVRDAYFPVFSIVCCSRFRKSLQPRNHHICSGVLGQRLSQANLAWLVLQGEVGRSLGSTWFGVWRIGESHLR